MINDQKEIDLWLAWNIRVYQTYMVDECGRQLVYVTELTTELSVVLLIKRLNSMAVLNLKNKITII